jgi:hypothetical protein
LSKKNCFHGPGERKEANHQKLILQLEKSIDRRKYMILVAVDHRFKPEINIK